MFGFGFSSNGVALLNRMGQFVGDQLAPLVGFGLALAMPEKDLIVDGEGAGAHLLGKKGGAIADVNTYLAKARSSTACPRDRRRNGLES